MNLHEQLNRAKELMGLQPLNEDANQYKGTLSNLLDKTEDGIPDEFDLKYGDISKMDVHINSFTTYNSEDITGNLETNQNNKSILDIIKAKTPSIKTLSDDNVKFYTESYVVFFESNGKTITYLKVLYYSKQLNTLKQKIENIKNCIKSLGKPGSCVGSSYELTDVKSSLSENYNIVCSSDSLNGDSEVCELPQDVKNMIINEYKTHKDFNTIKSLLNS